MPGAFNLPNKMESERIANLDSNITLSVEYLFVALMLKLACENSIKHKTLKEQHRRITENISSYQSQIEICESNLYVCEHSIEKYNSYILEKEEKKKKFVDLYQKLLALRKEQKRGDFPKTVDEIGLRENFVTNIYKFRFLSPHKLFPAIAEDIIYLKIDLRAKALFYTLKKGIEGVAQGHIEVGELWLAKKEGKIDSFRCNLENLCAKNISQFHISVLENLAERGVIPDPYEPEKIRHLENLIEDAYAKLERMQLIQIDNRRRKEEYGMKLATAQQKLAAIEVELEAITRQSMPKIDLEQPSYRLEIAPLCFFAGKNPSKLPLKRSSQHQLDIVEPRFFSNREREEPLTQEENKWIFNLNKSYQN